ncbi:conserved hypothetical protein [Luminiphilus syltensis NOR5-1B]|uniref:ThuA-like domain-containing protein n=1 Tax=Luminiphilus syltensis NOR5-1B TaxID=565045 RepID=B8KYF7_9GAMM|nr:ThuA domain-containing protein [Luminiphilus syltensis]EED35707.1 conserved hypothetical protein [Luminiphilus syltensis NOR5-1B]
MGIIDYQSPFKLLVSVKGHPYERDAFAAMLESFEGIAPTIVEQPATEVLIATGAAAEWDALLFYDMPGIDFSTQPPGFIEPCDRLRGGFAGLLERGMGMVFLHHALAGWPLWPEYGEVVGGRFFYAPTNCRGRPVLDSGYRHEVTHTVFVLDRGHPVTQGVEAEFTVTDELYLAEVFEDDVTPLLASSYEFSRDHFYSAHHAVNGRMFCNDDWDHVPGSSLIGWCRQAGNSSVVYLQPGDGPTAYRDSNYARLVENAVRWVAPN